MDDLVERLKPLILTRGKVTGSSGQVLENYLDVRKAMSKGGFALEIADRFGKLIPSETTRLVCKGLGGHLVAVALSFKHNLEYARTLDEKEMQLHNETTSIIYYGEPITEKDKLLIIDDVCTTGKSLREAREIIRPTKAQVIGYAVVIRRRDVELDAPLNYLFTEEDFIPRSRAA